MEHRKQILSLLLAFVFVLSLLPGFAFAENVVSFHNGALTQEQLDMALATEEEG